MLSKISTTPMIATATVVSILVLTPIVFLIYGSFRSAPPFFPGFFTLSNFEALLSPALLTPVVNSFAVATISVLVAAAIGTPLGWIISRTNTPFVKLLDYISLIPLFISPFTLAIGWILIGSPNIGYINNFFSWLVPGSGPIIDIGGFWAIVWVLGLFLSPYFCLFISNALRRMDPSLEEVARASGANTVQTTFRVTLPLITPAILSSVLITFVLALEHFSITTILGWRINFQVVTTRIFFLINEIPPQYGTASVLGLVILGTSLVGVFFYRRILGNKIYVTISGKGFRPSVVDLGKWKFVTLAFCLLYFVVSLGPFIAVLYTSFIRLTGTLHPLTLYNYENILFGIQSGRFWTSLRNSIILAFSASTLGISLSFLVSWIIEKTEARGRKILDYIVITSMAIPGMVMGVGMLWTYLTLFKVIYGTILILVLALVGRYIAQGVRSVSSSITQVSSELEESARVCGASWLSRIHKIVIPIVKPGITGGWILLFVMAFRDLSTVLLLWSYQTMPLSALMWEFWYEASYPMYSAIGVLQTGVIVVLVFAFKKLFGASIGAR